jgi:TDG/mug DNA glycosylase family protein
MRYTPLIIARKTSLLPIADHKSRVLILDTMPGEKSLILQQYYACKSNFFWKVMFKVLKVPNQTDYRLKKQLLFQHGIALWNVLEFGEEKNNGDYNITSETPNDFYTFFQSHPGITKIIFNGNNAAEYYQQHVAYYNGLTIEILPSTSALNTWKSFEEKAERWAMALK